jgi:hypothetical protein
MRFVRWLAGLAIVALAGLSPTAQADSLGALKSAYLLNFATFVTWPDEPKKELLLCVGGGAREAGEDASLRLLDGRSVRQMTLRLKFGLPTPQLAACDLVYLPVVDNGLIQKLGADSGLRGLLIVGAGETAAALGAGIGMFVAVDGRLAFDLNLGALQAAGLKFSTRLLPLARRVYE